MSDVESAYNFAKYSNRTITVIILTDTVMLKAHTI